MNESKLREIFARGLTDGLGSADGQTCIQGAISLATTGELSDTPECVADEDRLWSITINDAPWSSPEARAEALLPIALAQIGTAGTDRSVWVERVVLGTIQRVLPIALDAGGLGEHAETCRRATTLEEAQGAANAAYTAAYDAARAAARAADAANDAVLREAVAVALDAYRAEGRAS